MLLLPLLLMCVLLYCCCYCCCCSSSCAGWQKLLLVHDSDSNFFFLFVQAQCIFNAPVGLASLILMSGPNSERWASEMWPALASFPDPKIPIQICLIISTNKHRLPCSLIYGDSYLLYGQTYPLRRGKSLWPEIQ